MRAILSLKVRDGGKLIQPTAFERGETVLALELERYAWRESSRRPNRISSLNSDAPIGTIEEEEEEKKNKEEKEKEGIP